MKVDCRLGSGEIEFCFFKKLFCCKWIERREGLMQRPELVVERAEDNVVIFL